MSRAQPHFSPPAPLGKWTYDNEVRLLENGEAYYPAVIEAMEAAREEVLIETFILFDDEVGRSIRDAAIAAAQRGAHVAITVDGYGSPDLPAEFVDGMLAAGIDFRYFDPRPRLLGWRTNMFKRMHRKIVVIDRSKAFIGGINYSIDHLRKSGPKAKQDYAVEVRGPIVQHVHALAMSTLTRRKLPRSKPWWRTRVPPPPMRDRGTPSLLVWRDNEHHRDDIELHYRAAVRAARHDILIANAYFFPGYRLVRDLRHAARRGVRVRLVLQGRADQAIAAWAARSLYTHLIRAGVCVYEYCERPLHGKVAVIDDEWSTVGSSNLDPSSLSLNLEANLIFYDRHFAEHLRGRLEHLIDRHCKQADSDRPLQPVWRTWTGYLAFHLMRIFPRWANVLPRRRQPLVQAEARNTGASAP
jgi:cardiolipin synthase